MNINDYITGVTKNITNQLTPHSITSGLVGKALTDLANFIILNTNSISSLQTYVNSLSIGGGSSSGVTNPTTLATPNVAAISLSPTEISLSWAAVSNATSYDIFRSTANDISTASKLSTLSNTSYDDLSVLAATEYFYFVIAKALGFNNSIAGSITITTGAANLSKLQVVVDGDSLDRGYLSSNPGTTTAYQPGTTNWLAIVANNIGTSEYGDFSNYAVSGQYVTQMLSDANAQVFSTINNADYTKNLIVVGGGINDVEGLGTSAIDVYNNIKLYHQQAHAAGWATLALTHTSGYKDYGIGAAAANVVREQLDEMIRVGWKDDLGASAFVDLGKDPIIGVYGTPDFTYYNSDGQHFTDTGYAYKGSLIQPAIVAFKNGTGYGSVSIQAPTISLGVGKTVNWNASNHATNYVLKRGLSSDGSGATQIYSGSALTMVDTNAPSTGVYYYFVTASASGYNNSLAGIYRVDSANLATNFTWDASVNFNSTTGVWMDKTSAISATPTSAIPTLQASQINGLPTVRTTKQLRTPVISALNGNADFAMIVVTRVVTSSGGATGSNAYNANLVGLGDQLYTSSAGTNKIADLIYFNSGQLTFDTNSQTPTTSISSPGTFQIVGVLKTGNSIIFYNVNTLTSSQILSPAINLTSPNFTIGGGHFALESVAPGLENYTGDFAEVYLDYAPTLTNFNNKVAALKTKYAL